MQAIILAAGMGKRLYPYTKDCPKVLVEVNGQCLLMNALNQLQKHGVTEVIIVVGYMKDKIIDRCGHSLNGMKISYVENPFYDRTNNGYSLYLVREYIHDDIILLEGDLLYKSTLIDTILNSSAECNILVSRFNPVTMNGTVIMADGELRAKELVLKNLQPGRTDMDEAWKTVNVYKMQEDFFCNHFMPALETYIRFEGKNDYYEKVLGSLIFYRNHDIKIVPISGKEWFEIDDEADLRYAESSFIASVL